MTMTAPTEQQLERDLKDLDFEIACEARGCTRAADWWCVCLHCADHVPACEPHRRKDVATLTAADPRGLIACPRCRQAVTIGRWRDLLTFVPIGRT